MGEYNSVYFSKEQVSAGELTEFLNILLKQSYGKSKHFNDIHIIPADCDSFIIEWISVPWDHSYGGKFAYLNDDEVIMKQLNFPDNTYQYVFTEDEEEIWQDWLKNHPEYHKTSYGTWTNDLENDRLNKEFLRKEN